MRKCRIVIADTDINYILPLQLKFVEEFGDDIDLEIISDKGYFQTLFSTPQELGILIVSEELYDISLQRHFIGSLFLMTEQEPEEKPDASPICRLYKYSSIKEIFMEITGAAAAVLAGKKVVKTEPKILLVTSASGGTGKTTVAIGICESLTKAQKRALYINADRLQSFQYRMEDGSSLPGNIRLQESSEDVYADIRNEIRREDFSYVPAFRAPLMSLGIGYGIFSRLALSAKKSGEYDFIVVDADPAFDEYKTQLMSIADRVVIVVRPTESALAAANRLAASVNDVKSEKYLFVCNDYVKEDGMTSPLAPVRFTISEYIEPIENCEQMKNPELAKSKGIQRVALLVT